MKKTNCECFVYDCVNNSIEMLNAKKEIIAVEPVYNIYFRSGIIDGVFHTHKPMAIGSVFEIEISIP